MRKKIDKKKVQDALNRCFGHDRVYKGYIQVFPNAIYQMDGKKVLTLYEELGIRNKLHD
ncbi:hypothetical protein LCGC14_2581930 [marine sediment metagenome]|uniref:Uncharacterized protein n=1 Tax=marine sediment metagenome TaxID=412755 RepID=A0A0F9B245_9ZZZZ